MVRTVMFARRFRRSDFLVALVALLLGACEKHCTELIEDEAAQYAKKHALSRTFEDYETGNKWERRFVADLRKARISEEDYRRIIESSVKERPDISCRDPSIYYHLSKDEIAKPHYTITFKEILPIAENGRPRLVTFGIIMTLCGDIYDYWVPLDTRPLLVRIAKSCQADK